jgi:hypothetical protein
MADISRGKDFGATEEVTADKLHQLVDDATITGIVAADITDGVITDAKMASVGGAKLLTLGSTPSGAGILPVANGGTGLASYAQGDVPYASGATTIAKLGAGTAGQALTTGGAAANPAFAGMTTQGDIEYHNGTTRTRLAKGTASQQLRMNSGATAPEWFTYVPPAGVQDSDGDSVIAVSTGPTSSTDWQDIAGMSVSITLASAGSIHGSFSGSGYIIQTSGTWAYRMVYDTTAICTSPTITIVNSTTTVFFGAGTAGSVPAGTYTVKLQVSQSIAQSSTFFTNAVMSVFAY